MIHVVVTDNDMKVGKRKSKGYCPVSYALKRVFKRQDVEVTSSDYAWLGTRIVELPPHVGQFIQDFDKGDVVRSISFDLPDLTQGDATH
jgi:hypothetical protein